MDFIGILAAGVSVSADAELLSAASITALVTLTVMEIVLGVDNLVFVSIIVDKLPKEQQQKGRYIGMGLAMVMRLGLLFSIAWIMGLTKDVITIPEWMRPAGWSIDPAHLKVGLSWKDLILLAGGLFLIYKATHEIYEKLEGEHGPGTQAGSVTFASAIFQIILLDLVFSLDSVITAVGMIPPDKIILMVIAMVTAVTVMMLAANSIGGFVSRHPSVKILALSFLNLIGVMLLLEGTGHHVNKGYIYSAMGFSLLVEMLNMRYRKRKPVVLHEPQMVETK